jgi:hypothetical protein
MADNITIESIRQKFPQYGDMSDLELARALHAKYYSDIDKADFASKLGFKSDALPDEPAASEPAPASPQPDRLYDMALGVMSGLGRQTLGLLVALHSDFDGLGATVRLASAVF